MDPDDLNRRHVRKPKPGSKVETVTCRYWAFDAEGKRLSSEPVLLTLDRKKQYEERGYTFKPAKGAWY